MPYIDFERRVIALNNPRTSGELNYAFTMLCVQYLTTQGLSYSTINDCLGALDGAGKEFYRRVAVPYERKKCSENGDVYHGFGGAV